MARICVICGKKPSTGNNVSHAHNKSKRRWLPNLQRVKVLQEGTVKSVQVCTSCIRSGKITKAPHGGSRPKPAATNAT